MVFTGHCNRSVFTAWLERFLLPRLQPGQTVILDNARFHQAPTLATTLANAGCALRYLPPYSPDLNPIEHYWAPLKNRIRKRLPQTTSFFETVCEAFT
jgi:transposase